MEDYKPNSNLSKREEKKVEKVVSHPVKIRKKSGLTKFTDVFVQEDTQNVKNYIFKDVLIPALKKLFMDIVTNGVNMLLYGEDSRPNKPSRPSSNIVYGSYYNYASRNESPRYSESRYYDFDDAVFDNRGDAEAVLAQMDDILDKYRVVTVSDFYDLLGASGPYTANRYGWTSLRTAIVTRVRDGYVIKFPKAMPID